MDITTLKAHIKTKNFAPFYIFTGPEKKISDIYTQEMAKALGGDIKIFDSITPAARFLRTPAVMKSRHICVILDDKEILSNEEMQAFISSAGERTGYVVIVKYTTLDKRTKLYKNYSDRIVEFEYLQPEILRKYVSREVKLSDASVDKLIAVCEQDYGRILMETDKIRNYAEATDCSDEDAFQQLLADGTIHIPPTDAVFRFVDAVLANKPKTAFRLLRESLDGGEANLVLLTNLFNATKQVFQIQTVPTGTSDIAGATGLSPYQVRCAQSKAGQYTSGDLAFFMRTLQDVERKIKTGEMEESVAVPYALVNLW